MSLARPILQSNRQVDVAAAVGQTVFVFPLPLFDAADLTVQIGAGALPVFSTLVAGFVVALSPGQSQGIVTFAAPPRPAGAAALIVRLIGRRVQSRVTNVTRGGVVSSPALEDAIDRQDIILQELRRDVDGAVTVAGQVLGLTGGVPIAAPAASLWAFRSALAARGELAAVATAVRNLPLYDPLQIAWQTRDTVLAPGDPLLAFVATALADATPAANAARLQLAATYVLPAGPPADAWRAALAAAGLYGQLEAAVPADPVDPTHIEWFAATRVPYGGRVMALAAPLLAGNPAALLALAQASAAYLFGQTGSFATPAAGLRQVRTALAILGRLQQADAGFAATPGAELAIGGGVLGVPSLAACQWLGGSRIALTDPAAIVLAATLLWSPAQLAAFLLYAAGITFT